MTEAVSERAKRTRLLVLDVDGVLTDGSLYICDSGEEFKAFNTLDGHGMRMLKETGVEIAIISGRTSRAVTQRARDLELGFLYQGVSDKLGVFRGLLRERAIDPQASAFMGDDLPDLPCMRHAGFALSVPAAPRLIRENAHYVTKQQGGRGAVREVCELIMQAQGTLEEQFARFLRV
jgi:3-deoxy-D-manno-octulosonate 8-phosphate phosphatase (KDO 8-P phosphatase)